MKRILQLLFFIFIVGLSSELMHVNAQAQGGSSVIKLDPALDELISTDAKLETIRNDFGNTEGPNWVRKGRTGYLIFTDIAANVIYEMTGGG